MSAEKIKADLAELLKLAEKPPIGVPTNIISALKRLGEMSTLDNPLSETNFGTFGDRFSAAFNTIQPN